MNEEIDSKNDGERVQRGLRMPHELNAKVESAAKNKGVSINALIVMALWDYVKAEETEADDSLAVAA